MGCKSSSSSLSNRGMDGISSISYLSPSGGISPSTVLSSSKDLPSYGNNLSFLVFVQPIDLICLIFSSVLHILKALSYTASLYSMSVFVLH